MRLGDIDFKTSRKLFSSNVAIVINKSFIWNCFKTFFSEGVHLVFLLSVVDFCSKNSSAKDW